MALSETPPTTPKLSPETTAQFLSISQDFLELVNEYLAASPDADPQHYIVIINSLLHLIRDLETILNGVRQEIEETRLINNQLLSP